MKAVGHATAADLQKILSRIPFFLKGSLGCLKSIKCLNWNFIIWETEQQLVHVLGPGPALLASGSFLKREGM